MLRSAYVCGGIVRLGFTEEVVVPEPAPVTVRSIGLDLEKTCTRDTTWGAASEPTADLILNCPDLNDLDGARISLGEGIATQGNKPLKTATGDTTVELVLDRDLGTNICRSWQESVSPTF